MLNLSIFCRPTSLYKVSSYNSYQVFFSNSTDGHRNSGMEELDREIKDPENILLALFILRKLF